MKGADKHLYYSFFIVFLFFAAITLLILNKEDVPNTPYEQQIFDATLTPEKNIPTPPNRGVLK
jgi:hypothetical protein